MILRLSLTIRPYYLGGAAEQRKAITMLCECLSSFDLTETREEAIELTAQVIWSAAFGLIMRLVVEKDLTEEQIEALISCYLDSLVAIAVRGKEN